MSLYVMVGSIKKTSQGCHVLLPCSHPFPLLPPQHTLVPFLPSVSPLFSSCVCVRINFRTHIWRRARDFRLVILFNTLALQLHLISYKPHNRVLPYGWIKPQCVHILHFPHPVTCWQTSGLQCWRDQRGHEKLSVCVRGSTASTALLPPPASVPLSVLSSRSLSPLVFSLPGPLRSFPGLWH